VIEWISEHDRIDDPNNEEFESNGEREGQMEWYKCQIEIYKETIGLGGIENRDLHALQCKEFGKVFRF